MKVISPVKGTRDFYPEQLALRRWLYERIRSVSEQFGYQEYDGPFLERLELYAAKSGEELVKEQSFVFPDRSGELIALRPELTPSLARMIAVRAPAMPKPIRWWSFGPFWRYEQPQRGRGREFFQWNLDLIGEESPLADAEIAAVAALFLRSIGLGPESVRLYVNDRRLAEQRLADLGVRAEDWPAAFRFIDRRERMSKEQMRAAAAEAGLDRDQLVGLEQMLDDRRGADQSEALRTFFAAGQALGVEEYLTYDPSVVRGLDYYTGIVFEARDRRRKFRSILGGGRYDDLVSAVGGDPIPATGFAMGDMVIEVVLKQYGSLPALTPNQAQVLVVTFDEQTVQASLALAAELRAAGLRVEWYPRPDRLPKQLKYADRMGVPLTAILGPEELEEDRVAVKDMRSGEQQDVPRAEVVAGIQALL